MTAATLTTEQLAEQLAAALADREDITRNLDAALRDAIAPHLPDLRTAIATCAAAEQALLERVRNEGADAYPEGARSRTAHGIRYGYQKGKPKIGVDDHAASVAAARTTLSDADAAAVINAPPPSIRLDAIAGWTDEDLARILAHRIPGADEPFVRAAGGDLDRLVQAIGRQALKVAGEGA
jgi:hypothetical protein